ncbi:TonB-dependent receptor domain-containing protein [Pseudopedobacter beijingensis]|uniref:TonB-dependent receptor domain-containing protein n=1 Tax=Pseudopedobacter beijingensis TaxID=1207056 RepID=A0ABW4IAL9_9SPHI
MKSILWVSLCAMPFMAAAQEKQQQDSVKTTILNEIIINGYRLENPTFSKVSNNYDEKIVQPKNVAGLFNDINGFSLIKRGNYAMDPTFRGAQYEQLNIQYDGGIKAMHACPNRMDPITSHIAPEEIEKIEIIKGPYSVRYGATFGGIVNLVTRNPSKGKHGLHGSIASGYETNGNAYVGMAQLQYVTDKFDLAGNFGYRNYDNYKDGDGTEIPSAFKSTDYGLKFGYNIKKNHRIQAGWRQAFGRDVLHAGLPMDTEYDNSSIASLDYKWEHFGKIIQQFQVKTYYSYVDHLMTNFDRSSAKMTEASALVESHTAGVKAELEWKTSDKLHFFSGIDYLHIGRDGDRTRLIKMQNGNPLPEPVTRINSIWQDSYIDDWGIYTEGKWNFAPSYILTAGLRYDRVVSDIRKPENDFASLYDLEKRTESNISGTLSLKKAISNRLFLELAYGRGVRSANMIERYINQFNVGQDSYTYTGNPDLKAEINNQFEIGVSGYENLNGFFNTLHFEGSVYYAFLDNYISAVIEPTIGTDAKVFTNIRDAYKTGVDVSAKLDFANHYFLKTDLSYVYARNKDYDESLPLIPPFTARISAGFENTKFWGNMQYNIVATQNELAPSFGEIRTGGYQTMDVRLGYRPVENWSIGIAGLNIFDKTYHNHLNFAFRNQEGFSNVPINEQGRNFTVFVQYKF